MQVWHLILILIVTFAAGYAASIYSWQWIKEHFNGALTEARRLRARAEELEAKIRSKI